MLTVQGKNYKTVPEGIFEIYLGYPAMIVTGVNTPSSEAVVILIAGEWRFVNQAVR